MLVCTASGGFMHRMRKLYKNIKNPRKKNKTVDAGMKKTAGKTKRFSGRFFNKIILWAFRYSPFAGIDSRSAASFGVLDEEIRWRINTTAARRSRDVPSVRGMLPPENPATR